jgi:hypothetical protein
MSNKQRSSIQSPTKKADVSKPAMNASYLGRYFNAMLAMCRVCIGGRRRHHTRTRCYIVNNCIEQHCQLTDAVWNRSTAGSVVRVRPASIRALYKHNRPKPYMPTSADTRTRRANMCKGDTVSGRQPTITGRRLVC